MDEALCESLVWEVGEADGELVCCWFGVCRGRARRRRGLSWWLLVEASATKGSAGGMGTGRVELLDAL